MPTRRFVRRSRHCRPSCTRGAAAEMVPTAFYAIKLGQALQLTDILADVGEDWLTGRG